MSSPAASSFESALAAANECFVGEEYEEAAALYDAALRLQPSNAAALVARAANNIKRKQYNAALSDADAVLAVDGSNSLALYRRATALFYLDDFTAALPAFQRAEQLGNKQSALFIRKCHAELQRHAADGTAGSTSTTARNTNTDTSTATATATNPAATTPTQTAAAISHPQSTASGHTSVPASSGSGAAASSGGSQSSPAAAPLSARVTENWFQTRQAVTITLFAKSLTRDAVSVAVDPSEPHVLSARLQLPDGSVFDKRWSLFAAVQPSNVRVDITQYRVEVIAAKVAEEEWLGLLDTSRRGAEGVVKRDNVVRAEAEVSAYPSSSRKRVEWSEVESAAAKSEEEEKPQGDAALQKLFQTIYKDANEDTRRAMVKSFQTSGGTVLSTSWKDVKQTDYTKNREAPKGMEFREWTSPDSS